MRRVWETCKPYPEILTGTATEESFVANLGAVWERLKLKKDITVDPRYLNPEEFVHKRTYFTEAMENLLEAASRRLLGEPVQAVHHLEVGLGGGKSHTLVLLYHAAGNGFTITIERDGRRKLIKFPKSKVVVLDGQLIGFYGYPDLNARTLWGMMLRQLTEDEEILKYDSWETPPPSTILRKAIGEEPTVILVDELVAHLNSIPKEYWDKVSAFLHNLAKAVAESRRAVLIVTTPKGVEAFEKASNYIGDVMGRYTEPTIITRPEEAGEVRKRALFETVEVDEDTVMKFWALYQELRDRIKRSVSSVELRENYPFHPSVSFTLNKLRESPAFQTVRDELRLLAGLIYGVFKAKPEDCYLVSIADARLEEEYVRRGIAKVVGPRLEVLISEDLRKLGEIKDERLKALAKSVYSVIVLNSLAAPPKELGVTSGDIAFSIMKPGLIYESVQDALNRVYKTCYITLELGRYVFGKTPAWKVEEEYKKRVETELKGRWWAKIRDSIIGFKSQLKPSKVFIRNSVKVWPETSRHVDDDKMVKLVLLDYRDRSASSIGEALERAREFVEFWGEEPRRFRNTVYVLVADRSLIDKPLETAKRLLALKLILSEKEAVREKYGREIIESIEEDERLLKSELGALALQAYRYIVYPGPEGVKAKELSLDTQKVKRLLEIVETSLRGDKILEKIENPKYFLECYWPKAEDSYKVKDLLLEAFKRPDVPLIPEEFGIKESINKAIKEGLLVYVYDNEIFWGREPPYLNPEAILWREESARKLLQLELTVNVEPEEAEELDMVEPSAGTHTGYRLGDEVELKVSPNPPWLFKEWRLDDGTIVETPTCKLTMDRHRTVTAVFEKRIEGKGPETVYINVEVSPPGSGVIEPWMGSREVDYGAEFHFNVKPKADWIVKCWKFNDRILREAEPTLTFKAVRSGTLTVILEKRVEEISIEEVPFNELRGEIEQYLDAEVSELELEILCSYRTLLSVVKSFPTELRRSIKEIYAESEGLNVGKMREVSIKAKAESLDIMKMFLTQVKTYLGKEITFNIKASTETPSRMKTLLTDRLLDEIGKHEGKVKMLRFKMVKKV